MPCVDGEPTRFYPKLVNESVEAFVTVFRCVRGHLFEVVHHPKVKPSFCPGCGKPAVA